MMIAADSDEDIGLYLKGKLNSWKMPDSHDVKITGHGLHDLSLPNHDTLGSAAYSLMIFLVSRIGIPLLFSSMILIR